MTSKAYLADVEQSRIATARDSSKEVISESDLRLGLLAYPVLQAGDIMLYKYVPKPEAVFFIFCLSLIPILGQP